MCKTRMGVSRVIFLLLLWSKILILATSQPFNESQYDIAFRVLESFPLIDGHNDLPHNFYLREKNKISGIDLSLNNTLHAAWGVQICKRCHTDIPRLKAGRVGAQFWSAYVSCITQHKDAVARTLEQIDVIHRMVKKYSNDFRFVTTARGIIDAFDAGRIASLIGVEGGHSIDGRLAVLRMYYDLGVRYMTLAHNCNNLWAETSFADANQLFHLHRRRSGITDFGKLVVKEMNRLGMIIDLSHTSKRTQIEVLNETRAPVIYSHSNAFALCSSHRNVHDDVLTLVKENNGVVMVNFVSKFVSCDKKATIQDVANHINHIRRIAGINHVGIGADFDGTEVFPEHLEEVSHYPNLFALLSGQTDEPWSIEDLKKLAGLNLLRVFTDVEKVRDQMKNEGTLPIEDSIPMQDIGINTFCISNYWQEQTQHPGDC